MNASHKTEAFREKYRAQINPSYRWYWHAGLVILFGGLWVAWLLPHFELSVLSCAAFILGLLMMNVGEYVAHRYLGHYKRRFAKLFYQRHTGDHHSFFVENAMEYIELRDLRVVWFPVYLVVVHSLLLSAPMFFMGQWLGFESAGAGLALGLTCGYLFYEVMHYLYHLPEGSFVERWPVLRELQHLHRLHHRREIMTTKNFNITVPLMDVVMGTFFWEPIGEQRSGNGPADGG